MKVLLHICCGACAIYPIQLLRKQGYEVEGFYYNPNIHPPSEYKRRFETASIVCHRLGLNIIAHRYDFEDFLKRLSRLCERREQHRLCWRIRLEESAKAARAKGIPYFTTTLLSSPHQDIKEITDIAQEVALAESLNFLVRNFRRGFSDSHRISKEWQLYHQNYCGCADSEKESIEQRRDKWLKQK